MRTLQVDAGRLERWCTGFAERHGDATVVRRDDQVVLTAADGATAWLEPAFALPDDVGDVAGVLAWVAQPRRCCVLLLRRGGYGCAVIDGDRVTASKVGTRYVQSRTAAGGWSQQRFARRREGQAKELVGAVADVAVRILLPALADGSTGSRLLPPWLVTGGDRPLVDAVMADPRLRRLAALARGPHLPVGDPRSDVVKAIPGMLRSVRIRLTEPDGVADGPRDGGPER